MNNKKFSSKCKELVNTLVSTMLEYVGDEYAAYMTDDMFIVDVSVCLTGNPSAHEPITLRRFVVQVGMSEAGHKVEGFSDKEGTLRAEDMPVTFDDILEEENGK